MFRGFGPMGPMRPYGMWGRPRHWRRHWRRMYRPRSSCCCLPFFVLMLLPFALLLAWGAMHIL